MHTFEVVILGASGGPDAGATQCFLVRPAGWQGLESVCVDGGAGTSQIARMIASGQCKRQVESFYANDYESVEHFLDKDAYVDAGLPLSLCEVLAPARSTAQRAFRVYQAIRSYYVTHAHLDHIAAMVLDTPLIFGTEQPCSKTICGLPFTTQAIQQNIFNDAVWPNLLQGGGGLLRLDILRSGIPTTCQAFEKVEVTPFPVNHGMGASERHEVYSTVYLFRDKTTGNCILICGDVEPDGDKEPLLAQVWSHIAANVPLDKLKAIIIECSSTMATKELYGHLGPRNLVEELTHLQGLYGPHALGHMHVIITHVKSICSYRDPRLVILEEVRKEASRAGLHGIIFSVAVRGYTFHL
ncbi:related to PDE1-Low affinity 3`,5`-cyclic-nucleotide phosphodiesterase [Zygosaccharomyces bailii ISA1307]|nr:related to PDE1-Low affinity 3`,5`-cyclic-nucleotide phosphodiesterase [Zygosaccharomyces bailii ISA1307]